MPECDFKQALSSEDLVGIRNCEKSDYHNHGCLGYPLSVLRDHVGFDIPAPPSSFKDFESFVDYLSGALHPHIYSQKGFEFSVDAALKQAASDGVTILEISIDAQIMREYNSVAELVSTLQVIDQANPSVRLGPEIGINRIWDTETIEQWVNPMIDTGYFRSIDLYGNEKLGEPEKFVKYYKRARSKGMLLKAHAGEYLDAEFVRRSVEVLDLDEVQHGIAAAQSKEVMDWLAARGTVLHICPSSNVILKRVPSIAVHPIRELYRNGVAVTINSDDIMVFNQSVSEEYLALHQHEVLTPEELDDIRQFGLGLRAIKKR